LRLVKSPGRGTGKHLKGKKAAAYRLPLFICIIFRIQRHRVVSAGMERMALQYPFGRQPGPFQSTMFPDCLNAVIRTCRIEPAAWREHRRDELLIEPEQRQEYSTHNNHQTFFFVS